MQIQNFIASTAALRKTWVWSLIVGAYSALVYWKESTSYHKIGDHPAEIYVSLSLVLGLLLAFRTRSAYERWWEARKQWGKLVNISRNLVIKAQSVVNPPQDELERHGQLIIAFAYALKDRLRGHAMDKAFPILPDVDLSSGHIPNRIALVMYQQIMSWRDKGLIKDEALRVMDSDAREFMEVCGACERILLTPLSVSYRVFLHQCVILFLVTLPWGLVEQFQYWTIPLTIVNSYFMVGIETMAYTIEEPFGEEEDDLDLEGICLAIETTVEATVNESL